MILSEEVKLYEIVGPQLKLGMWILKEFHIRVRCTDSINTLIMLDSPENLYMMK
jgi:hypothetical protein